MLLPYGVFKWPLLLSIGGGGRLLLCAIAIYPSVLLVHQPRQLIKPVCSVEAMGKLQCQ